MKLHLPTLLRKAVLACMASVATVTFATGTSWADTYDLLASGDAWSMSCRTDASDRVPQYHAATDGAGASITTARWAQALAVTTAGTDKMYTVGADNTLTFTMTMKSGAVDSAVMAVTLTGTTQTIALGVLGYSTNDIKYGLTSNTTADIYFHGTQPGDPWSSGDAYCLTDSDVAAAIGTRTTDAYTLQGVVTLGADNAYTMDLTLNGELVADDVALGENFDITRVSLETDGENNYEFSNLTITGALADIPSVTIVGNGTNDDRLINTPAGYKIILNLDGENNDYLYAQGKDNTNTIANDVEIQSCIINNGNSGTTYKFTGTITGSGEFTRPSGASSGKQTYEFSGDMSAYTGAMSLLDNESNIVNRDTLIFNGNTSGTGAITTTNYNRVVVQGATMQNASITATYLEISGASSFAGDVSISTLLTLGANQSITLGADASLTLGENALIDLTNATCTEDAMGNKVYTIFTEGSVGTHNLADLTIDNIKDAEVGTSYSYENGVITISTEMLTYGDGTMRWNEDAANTPFTNASSQPSAFEENNAVTFNGTGTANVTLGADITASGVTVADTATVNLQTGGFALAAGGLTVNGTLNVAGQVSTNQMILGESASMVLQTGSVLDLTGVDANVNAADFATLNTDKIVTQEGAYVKLAFNHQDNASELKLEGHVSQAYNIEAVGAMMIHGNGTSNSYSYTVGAGKSLIANGSSHGLTGLALINHGVLIVDGGSVETSNLILGHSSGENSGAYWGKLTMGSGSLKVGTITLRQNHSNEFTVTGGELEFTAANVLSRGGDDRTTITIKGIGAGDAERVTLKADTVSWALDGAGLTTAPSIGNATVVTAAEKTMTLSNVALSGALVKTGAGRLALGAGVAVADLTRLDVQQGFVSSSAALTLADVSVAAGAGFAYDLSSAPALITAANYSGALILQLHNAAAGDYQLFQGAADLSADAISVIGVNERMNVTKQVTDGLVSINITPSGVAMNVAWDPNGPSNVWNTVEANWDSNNDGAANTVYQNGDTVVFGGTGEQITIHGDVTPASVTVSGKGYAFAGDGKITGDASLTVANGGSLEIKSAQRYTGGTTVAAGGELILSAGGGSGAVKGEIDVYGTLKLNHNDATGWGNNADTISALNIMDGGVVEVTTTANQTAAGLAVSLQGGSLTGIAGSKLDLYFGGGDKYASITALAADGATAEHPTVSTISGVKLGMRQRPNVFTVKENARLVIESVIWDNTNGGLVDPAGSDMTLTKAGAGEMVLKGANTYEKATTVEAGTLTLADGGVLNSAVTVQDGATFKLAAETADVTFGGSKIEAAGNGSIIKTGSHHAIISPVAAISSSCLLSSLDLQGGYVQNAAGTLTIAELTAAAGTGFVYDLSLGQKKVVATGYDGAITLDLAILANGTFELFQGAAGLTAEDVNFVYTESSRSQVTTSVENGLAKVTVVLSGGALDNLVWNTNGASDVWGAGGAANWTSNGNSEQFFNGDTVTFSGTGEAISIVGTVTPAGTITVDGTGYVFEGSGSIGGSAALLVTNGGELTISTANSYTGGTTIGAGSTLTMANTAALGGTAISLGFIPGKITGVADSTLVIDVGSGNLVYATGTDANANLGSSFTGIIDVKSGGLQIGGTGNPGGSENATFGASKVIVRDGAILNANFGTGRINENNSRTLSSNLDLMAGSTLFNYDGNVTFSGNIRFNVKDDGTFDSTGVVKIDEYWQKKLLFTGTLEGAGTVQLANSAAENKALYSISGEGNTFSGTYQTLDDDGNNANKIIELRLGHQTAAQYADVNLATTTATSYLLLDSDATINGLYGLADNYVQAQGAHRTLTVSEGDFAGSLINFGEEHNLSLTKQGTGTLVLRGENNYRGATTITEGGLELAAGSTLGTTEITVQALGSLTVASGTYSNIIKGTGTIYKDYEGSATLSRITDEFTGRIVLQNGTLNVGQALHIDGDRELSVLMQDDSAPTLSSALTLGGGTLDLDFTLLDDASSATGLSLNNGALTLAGGTTLSLTGVSVNAAQGDVVTLMTGVGSLLGANGSALNLGTDSLAGTYFSSITGLSSDVDVSVLGLQLNDGKLQLIIPVQDDLLVWGEGTGTWVTDGEFSAEDEDFTTSADVEFGPLTGERDTVTISGALSVGKMVVEAGEGKTYIFAAADAASGLAAVEKLVIGPGTASFGEGTLDMTEGSITVNNGGTLSLANGAITNAGDVGIALNNGSTLEWQADNTTDYSDVISVSNGATVTLDNASGSAVNLIAGSLNAEGETATVQLNGGTFKIDYDLVYGNISLGTGAKAELLRSSGAYTQNISGEGGLIVKPNQGVRRVSGTNTYSGVTELEARLVTEGAQALSANTTIQSYGGELFLSKAAGSETETYTINKQFNTGTGLKLYVGLNSTDADNLGAVTGVTLNLGEQSVISGDGIFVRGGNAVDVAAGASVTGKYALESGALLTVHSALSNAVEGAGTVQVDGTGITWDATSKTYTGETQILDGSDVTAAAPISTGAGKVQLMGEDSVLTITNSASWANKVYGAGALVLVNTVDNLDAIVDGTAADTLATLYVGKPMATYTTTDVDGLLVIDGSAKAAAAAKIETLVVNAGSRVELNRTQSTQALGQNLVLSGAGDAAASAGSETAAALTVKNSQTKTITSNISLADDATVYVTNGGCWFSGNFDSDGHTLVKTGTSWLGLNGSSIDLTGGMDIQAGTMEINLAADAPANTIGAVNMDSGTTLQLKGGYEMTGGLAVDGTATIKSKEGASVLVSSAVTGDAADKIALSRFNDGAATLTLGTANTFSGTWEVQASLWTMELAHADAVKDATVFMNTSATLKLTDEVEDYNISALKSTITSSMVQTAGATRHGLIISNAQTGIVADATFAGSIAGTIDVSLVGGTQKLTGALGAGSTYAVSNGTLAIASANQTGDHSFTATGGVLDMAGYTRSADANTGTDTIIALGGQVNGLTLAANMVLRGTDVVTAAMDTITLGGATELGAGQMNFRVADSTDNTNVVPGNTGATYKETNTKYQVGADGTISLAGASSKTYLNISLVEPTVNTLDPTPATGVTAAYRDHLLISGISGITLDATTGLLDATAYFDMNLETQYGSTQYKLLFVQNATDNTLVDLVLRASGSADTLFWGNAAGGAWNTAKGQDDWVAANLSGSAPAPTTTPADFEQYDHVIFGDLAGATDVVVTVEDAADGTPMKIGSIIVNANNTNYTINGNIGSAEGNTGATLTKTGTGTLTLNGANSYAGNTSIAGGGTLIAQHDAALSNTKVELSNGTLVLDLKAGTDRELDAWVHMKGGNTIKATEDATLRVYTDGNNKNLQAAAGKTLTLKPVNNNGADGTELKGQFLINGVSGMTGTVALQLQANKTYTHNNNTQVYAGEYVISGAADTTLEMGQLLIGEGATARVQGGMTLQASYLEGPQDKGYGKLVLEDASTFIYAKGTANHSKTIGNAIVSEGATLQIGGEHAATTTLTLQAAGLTLLGAGDTTLSGGTWVLQQGAAVWGTDAEGNVATGALAIGANTTVKVNDDTMKSVKVNSENAVLTTAKSGGNASALSVGTIAVANHGTVQGVNLTITGTGSSITSETNGNVGTADAVVVNLDNSIAMDANTPTALEIGGGVVMDSLTINRGEVKMVGTAWDRKIGGDAIVVNGAEAVLNLNGLNKVKNAAGQAPTILINAGKLMGAGAFTSHVVIDDKGNVLTDGITLDALSNNATVQLASLSTSDTAMTTLKGMQGLTLAAGSAITLTNQLEEGKGNLMFDFADNATGTLKMANGATLSIDVNSVLGDVLDSTTGGVTYTLADADITALAGKVAYDAALSLFNITTEYTADGKLVLSQTDIPLSADLVYRSSEDNVDGTQWAGNGTGVYASADVYAAVYIDKDTTIDLTAAAPDAIHAEDGLVLSNLIGRGNGADLTIEGNGDDLVTINNNLDIEDLGTNVKVLSFNGDMDVTGTELQIKNTVATPGAADAGKLDTDSLYQINGNLTMDADSPLTVTAGILKLNGQANQLLGGVTVEDQYGQLQISGNTSVDGALQLGHTLSGDNTDTDDVQLLSGGKLTLLDGAAIGSGLDIKGEGRGKETLSVDEGALATLSGGAGVKDAVLDLQEGSTLQLLDGHTASVVELDGLTGSGALVNDVANGGQASAEIVIAPMVDSTFSGDLSGYEGCLSVKRDGSTARQTLDKVTTAAAGASKLDLYLNGDTIINVAETNGNKTLNVQNLDVLRDSITTIEVNADALVAGNAPALTVSGSGTVVDVAELVLSANSGTVLSDKDTMVLMTAVGNGDVSSMEGKSITLDITDDAFRKLSANATLRVENGQVIVNTTASETNRYTDAVKDENALAGAELLWPVNPSELKQDSALKAVDQAVADLLKGGNTAEAERVLAAAAGASTAVLGSALSGDVERQLRAIRNRTTTMGVNQCEVNEGMPYVNAWINAEGDHSEMTADGLAAGYTLDSWGGTVGFDVDMTNHLTMGLAVTAMYGDLTGDGPETAEGDFDTQYVSFFARVADRAWTHTFVATVGRADVSLTRTVNYGSGSYKTEGDTNGSAYGFMYEVARTFALSEDGTTCWQPVFNVAWRHSSIDAYSESGCDAALEVGSQDMSVLTFGLGARLQSVIGENLYNRASIFETRALVKVDAGDRAGETNVALLGGANTAKVKAAEVGAVGVELGAGVTIPMGMDAGSIFIDASAELRSGYTNVNGTVGYRVNF